MTTAYDPFLDTDKTAGRVLAIVMGFILLIENIFLACTLNGAKEIPSPARRLVVHQAVVLILMGLSLIRSGLVFFLNDKETTERECVVSSILQGLTENLASWGVVLMALFALALQDPEGTLHAVVRRGRYQAMLIAATWLLVLGEFSVTYNVTDRYTEQGCEVIDRKPRLIHGVMDTVCVLLLATLLVLYAVSHSRAGRAVRSDSEMVKQQLRLRLPQKRRVANTMVIQCLATLVLIVPSICVDLVHSAAEHSWDDVHVIGFMIYLMVDFSYLILLVVFFARHADLRAHFKRVFCRKCMLYEETFTHRLHSRYDTVTAAKEILRIPRVAADFLSDPHKHKTLARMPALKESAILASESNVHLTTLSRASLDRHLAKTSVGQQQSYAVPARKSNSCPKQGSQRGPWV